ncbi:hypothetical protein HMPREF0973_02057 [Prevotella veroralis F0319]|uniref:Uncharacterized protein n=1 Tax=Prevotella veroralis F0319 TaxID=649761 RepID=C9MR22_9BACT|nr:hypothetical protein HMPREF0973_02057 [Prevotella veroralis F0319]
MIVVKTVALFTSFFCSELLHVAVNSLYVKLLHHSFFDSLSLFM